MKKKLTFTEFWPLYLREHRHPINRGLHYGGTITGVAMLVSGLFIGSYLLVLIAPVIAYGCAWTGHFFFEKNMPATFTYPIKSLIADFVMFGKFMSGRLKSDLHVHDISFIDKNQQ